MSSRFDHSHTGVSQTHRHGAPLRPQSKGLEQSQLLLLVIFLLIETSPQFCKQDKGEKKVQQ